MTRRRGLTLIELLVVVAVLAVIVGISAPSLLDRRADVDLAGAVDRTRAALTMARARAMEVGEPMQVLYVADARTGRLVMQAIGAADHFADRTVPIGRASPPDDLNEPDPPPRTIVLLPLDVRIVPGSEFTLLREGAIAELDGDDSMMWEVREASGPEEAEVAVVVFLPDGAAVPSEDPPCLIDRHGRFARIDVSRATGVATLVVEHLVYEPVSDIEEETDGPDPVEDEAPLFEESE